MGFLLYKMTRKPKIYRGTWKWIGFAFSSPCSFCQLFSWSCSSLWRVL